jgi:hypothetical protein
MTCRMLPLRHTSFQDGKYTLRIEKGSILVSKKSMYMHSWSSYLPSTPMRASKRLFHPYGPTLPLHESRLNPKSPRHFSFRPEILENMIHLLQTPPVGLRHKEPSPDETQHTKHGEEDISAKTCVLHQRGSNEADDEIVKPIGGGGETNSLCA